MQHFTFEEFLSRKVEHKTLGAGIYVITAGTGVLKVNASTNIWASLNAIVRGDPTPLSRLYHALTPSSTVWEVRIYTREECIKTMSLEESISLGDIAKRYRLRYLPIF